MGTQCQEITSAQKTERHRREGQNFHKGELRCWGILQWPQPQKDCVILGNSLRPICRKVNRKFFKNFDPAAGARGTPLPGGFSGRCGAPDKRSGAAPGGDLLRSVDTRSTAPPGAEPTAHTAQVSPLSSLKVHRAARSRARHPHGSSFTPPLLQGPPRRLKPSPPPSTARVSSPLLPGGPPRRPAFHSSFKLKSHPSLPTRSVPPSPAPRGLSPWTGEAGPAGYRAASARRRR